MTRLRVSLLTRGDPGKLSGGYIYHRRMAQAAAGHDVELTFVSLAETSLPLTTAASWRTLQGLKHRRPDALVIDSIVAAGCAPWTGSLPIPAIASVHQVPGGAEGPATFRALRSALDLRCYIASRRLIVASEYLKQVLARRGVPPEVMIVAAPGSDLAAPVSAPQDRRAGRRLAALAVANWVENKGILHLLGAVARLPRESVTLHLAGGMNLHRRYGRRVLRRLEQPELRDRVVVHGPITQQEVAALYRDCDILVATGFGEAYATACGEAMAFGLPVVGWRSGNLPHMVSREEGVLVPPGDTAELGDAIRVLSDEPERLRRLSDASLARSYRLPSWEDTARTFFGAIRAVVHQAR